MSSLMNWASLGLLLFYAAVGYFILNPEVSESYENYYILRTSKYSPILLKLKQDSLPELEINRVYTPEDGEGLLFESGWSDPEPGHRWTSSTKAKIAFKLSPNVHKVGGKIVIRGNPLPKQRMVVWLNDSKLFDGVIPFPDFSLEMIYDPDKLNDSINELVFLLPNAKIPNNSERRTLALNLISLQVN